jgi:EAL domain-containing protein (putative c-di-GMP-specific phosphodiesterase class I)
VLAKATQGVQDAVTASAATGSNVRPGAHVDRAEEERIAQWVERIRNALAGDDGFVLNYQPIISLQGDGSEVYEALLRLKGSDGDPVEAGTFYADRRRV